MISDILVISQCLWLANPMRPIPSGTLEAPKLCSRPLGTRTRKSERKIIFNRVKKWFWKCSFFEIRKCSDSSLITRIIEPFETWEWKISYYVDSRVDRHFLCVGDDSFYLRRCDLLLNKPFRAPPTAKRHESSNCPHCFRENSIASHRNNPFSCGKGAYQPHTPTRTA